MKYLAGGTLNPMWKPGRGGAHVAKTLPDGTPNPKFVPYAERPSVHAPPSLGDLDPRMLDLTCLNCDRVDWLAPVRPDASGSLSLSDLAHRPKGSLLYCSEYCEQEADFVRYARRVSADGRIDRPDVQEALHIRHALLLGGGYPGRDRQLTIEQRKAAFEVDGGKCRKCGAPATDIDHIGGGPGGQVNDLANLQALCKACHGEKTRASFVKITENDPQWDATQRKAEELARRVEARVPERTSDDEVQWPKLWARIRSARRQRLIHGGTATV